MNQTPIRHFGDYAAPAVSVLEAGIKWLFSSAPQGCAAGVGQGRNSRCISEREWPAHMYIPLGICRVDQGNSLKPRIKRVALFISTDSKPTPDSTGESLVAWLLPFIVFMWMIDRMANGNTGCHCFQNHISYLHFSVWNLQKQTAIGSSVDLESSHSALKLYQCLSDN